MISFVLPVFNEAECLEVFHSELCSALDQHPEYEYELIYVDDGSRDGSGLILEDLAVKDERVRVLSLTRNFGHQAAISAGLDHSRGDATIIMDTDLQDPPPVAFGLIAKWREGWDVVYAQRRIRDEGWFKRASAAVFYRLLSTIAEVEIPRNVGDFRLADRRVVQEIRRFTEHDRFVRGMFAYVGFRQTGVEFDRPARVAGTTSYPLVRMMKLASDGVFAFSTAPLRFVRTVGFVIAGLAFLGAAWVLAGKLFQPESVVPGWTFIVISVLFVGGVQIIMLGVVGSYVGRTYSEAKNRPLYVVRSGSDG
ncbi:MULTISPECIES: glycosyltransferase family 2 protein [Aeromicrobium]|nr:MULTISPECIES: glycosyltransferase family 2 protein [Aeromicrobium]